MADHFTGCIHRSKNLFSMRWEELNQDFNKHIGNRIPARTGRVLGSRPLEADTINNELMRWIRNNGLPYIWSNQRLWFSDNGENWSSFEAEVSNGIVTFYEAR